jgi:hypothetical protein
MGPKANVHSPKVLLTSGHLTSKVQGSLWDHLQHYIELLGLLAALFVLVALVAAGVVSLHQQWTRIAVRVAGSWMAAIGLLMLGWALRGGN